MEKYKKYFNPNHSTYLFFENKVGGIYIDSSAQRVFLLLKSTEHFSYDDFQHLLSKASVAIEETNANHFVLDGDILKVIDKLTLAYYLSCWKKNLMIQQGKLGQYADMSNYPTNQDNSHKSIHIQFPKY